MKKKSIRRATSSERILLACNLITRLVDSTPVFEHAPNAAFILKAATHLILAPPPVRETVWRKLCTDNLRLCALAAGDGILLDSEGPCAATTPQTSK